MKILGLTGSIASGKSTIAGWLTDHGAIVLDADPLVHELYRDQQFSQEIADNFGELVLAEDGTVDRKVLGSLVFGNPHKLARLEAVVHPAVTALRDDRLEEIRASSNPPEVVVMDAVKLVESGQYKICQTVWCVVVDREIQIQRLMKERNLTHRDALQRIVVQPPAEKKETLPHIPIVYIENNGTLEELFQKINYHWRSFEEREIIG